MFLLCHFEAHPLIMAHLIDSERYQIVGPEVAAFLGGLPSQLVQSRTTNNHKPHKNGKCYKADLNQPI